ncbi:MAG: hypothetical protein NPIRA04_12810 [Nitrospirales bacterium]|nr:MAG: hypothetical protein NPIRA04_12810 [Nitrospirales bacterium]
MSATELYESELGIHLSVKKMTNDDCGWNRMTNASRTVVNDRFYEENKSRESLSYESLETGDGL